MNHQAARRDAEVLVAKGLSPKRHEALRAHLRGCDDCVRHYERLREVEDALAPEGQVMAPHAFERLADLVVEPPAPAFRGWWLGFSAAAAMAVVMLVVMPRKPDEFATRGRTASVTHQGLSVFLIDPISKQATRAEIRGQHVTVPAGQLVQLAYRNGDARYLAVVGVDGNGDAELYYPADGASGVRLVDQANDEPLPGAWNLEDVSTPLRLVAFFANEPIDITAALAEAKGSSGRPTLLIDVAKR